MESLENLAVEALDTLKKIADTAESQSHEVGLSMSAFATVNASTAMELADRINTRTQERMVNLAQLQSRPAIARLVIADEDNRLETIYITLSVEANVQGVRLCSYNNNKGKGRLASLQVGDGADVILPSGTRYFEVRERLTFDPTKIDGEWDSRPAIHFRDNQAPLTIKSLLALLRDQGANDEEIDEYTRQLAEADADDNIKVGLQRAIIGAMELRTQPILDKFQDSIFRLPLDSRLVILGPPGSGKTTTLIKRLSQKIDLANLDPDELELAEAPSASGLLHHHNWLMFTPTALLKDYVKSAFNKLDVPVSPERMKTWDEYSRDIARRSLPILRSGNRKGMVLKQNTNILKSGTITRQIEWFEAFAQFQNTLFVKEVAEAARRLAAVGNKDVARIGASILSLLEKGEMQPVRLLASLAEHFKDLTQRLTDGRKTTREKLTAVLRLEVNKDRALLADLVEHLRTMAPESDDDPDDVEVDDDEDETSPKQGLRAADAAFYKALRAKAVAEVTKRAPSKTSRNAVILAWLEARGVALPELRQIGETIMTQRAMTRISRAPANYVNGIPARYRLFRREAVGDGIWYSELSGPADIDASELDVILLSMLQAANQMSNDEQLMRRLDESAPSILSDVANLTRTQILVDEATDFSPIQLACMASLCDQRTRSFCAIGDFNQRLTRWGTRNRNELKWIIPSAEVHEVTTVYRQSRRLTEFANSILSEGDQIFDSTQPMFVENEGVAPVLGLKLSNDQLIAEWIALRIGEIESVSGNLPSIAILVSGEDRLEAVANALNTAVEESSLRAVACPKGQSVGPENDIRVFSVEHIKGLEFEAIFFVDIDFLEEQAPDLFQRYIYVGATRAATFLGLTCKGRNLPPSMQHVADKLEKKW
jgi:ABC-type cobalamin/Fe3+-siderophores transport system ATPase subunit